MNTIAGVKIFNLFPYQAPAGTVFTPRQIPAGKQEIEVIVSGYGSLAVADEKIRLVPGTAAWFCAEEWIHIESDPDEPYHTVVFIFEPAGASDYRGTFAFEWESPASCGNFCQTALECFLLKNFPPEYFGECLYGRMVWEAECSRRRRALRSMPSGLEQALRYARGHYAEPVTVADIAAACDCSISHLHALFQHHLGVSPFQYILKRRLDRACRLLAETSLSIKEVCEDCGFSDIKNFCAYFKRNHRLTPSEYRRLTEGSRNPEN